MTTLQSALNDLAARHGALRTVIVGDEGDPHARVHPPSPVELTVKDLSSAADEYGEYACWQRQMLDRESAADARECWQAKLAGGKILTLSTDRARELDVPPVYSVYRFLLDQQLTSATTALARSMHSTQFMVLYACLDLLLHRRTGVSDIVVLILMSGRADPEFHRTVGPLFSLLPIRPTCPTA